MNYYLILEFSLLFIFLVVLILLQIIYNQFINKKKILENSKKTEDALRESEQYLKSISSNFKAGMLYQVSIKPDGTRKFTFLSDSVIQLYGVTPEEGLENPNLIYSKVHPEEIDKLIKMEVESIKTYSDFKAEVRIMNPSGDYRWSSLVSTPKFLDDGTTCFDGVEFIITDRKLAEQAHQLSVAQLRANLDNTPNVAIQWYDEDGRVLYWNHASETLYGWKSEDAVGKTLDALIHTKEEAEEFKNILADIKATGKPFGPYEAPIKRGDGSQGWVLATTFGIPMEEGKMCFSCMDVDITERKEAEEKLKKSEERFQLVIKGFSGGVWDNWMVNNDNTWWSPKFYELLDYKPFEIKASSENWRTMLHPDDVSYILKVLEDHYNHKSDFNVEYRLKTKSGNYKWFLVTGQALWDDNDKPVRIAGSIVDITERKEAEEKLKESEERFKSLSEASFEGIMIHIGGIIQDTNMAFAKMSGFAKPEDLIGKNGLEMIPFTPESKQKVKEHIIAQTSDPYEVGLIQQDNSVIQAETQARGIFYRGRNARVVAMRDISEKKVIENELENYRNHLEFIVKNRTEELAAANEELNATNEELFRQREELQVALDKLNDAQNQLIQSEKMASLGILSAGIAHEINNPLNFIHGGILAIENYLIDNLESHFSEIKPLINAVNIGVERATNIVTSLSHYSRKDDLKYTDCDLHSIIDNCIIMLQNHLKNKVEIIREFTVKPYRIFSNEGKLHQAFLNIISNAEQAIDNKGTITINSDIIENFMVLKITDNGHGISNENMNKIFDPFFTTKSPGRGTGLGLSITYNIIQENNGTIEYQSQEEKGTSVIIKLPVNKIEKI
jgi:PAS domain S-box-containing protein